MSEPLSDHDYIVQTCAFCLKPISYKDVLWPNGLQVLDFGARAHRRCYQERYAPYRPVEPKEEQATMFNLAEPTGAASERE